jgi:hypothetical protein
MPRGHSDQAEDCRRRRNCHRFVSLSALVLAGYSSSASDAPSGPDTSSAPGAAQASDTTSTVLRFVKQSASSYFYTTSPSDRHGLIGNNPDLRFEKALFRIATTEPDAVPVHRFYRTDGGGHLLTASEAERTAIVSGAERSRFQYDGVVFYVPRADYPGTVPVFRLSHRDNGAYLYTADSGERASAIRSATWRDEGIVFHAFPAGRQILSGVESAERDRLEQLEARLTRKLGEGGGVR